MAWATPTREATSNSARHGALMRAALTRSGWPTATCPMNVAESQWVVPTRPRPNEALLLAVWAEKAAGSLRSLAATIIARRSRAPRR